MSDHSGVALLELDRDRFLRWLTTDVAEHLEAILGLVEASGYLSMVGDSMGARLLDAYRTDLGDGPWGLETVGEVLVDLKQRIDGGFEVVEVGEDEILLHNSRCPFGEMIDGHRSLCMMTSNVFGRIAAEQFGQARVELQETIANGDGRCVVRVSRDLSRMTDSDDARDYYADPQDRITR